MKRMKDEWKDNEKWSFIKWSLVKITLKHNLGLFILSFETINTLHTWKFILIERGYLDWRAFSLRKFFVINEGRCLLSSAKILDKSFTCSEWIFKCIIGQSKNEKERKKKNDSRVKTRKGGLEQKWENFQRLVGEANRRIKGQRSDSIRNLYVVFYLSQNQKFELFVPECLPSNSQTYQGWVLTPVKLPYSGTKKMDPFKMLDFQRIHFLEKGLGNVPPLLFNQIVKINLLSQIIRF